ncbi:hypothetical protein COCSUDRAFT_60985 [Coccomyxa subellipsoidea C-169]|uniref:Uncharacterized protein n=1 Tax=Coccomyxa subellipsoidea (strain C-169) TaxID=574566 RepID=I0Z5R9_COCSC|nr:hypothetical protein COCSUDRAFT_60985 [Coccomyxa subellipsoidea C-169]EIE25988.1 hypothetical protein COCSUDRAFT_60985 [Coccomyxa subellipsoidea C-169]|eukprot:XP_005650532.1 hypothetical protein COCSUDRAFT_60985 [Coccomyxa subellipsoidea C-169]
MGAAIKAIEDLLSQYLVLDDKNDTAQERLRLYKKKIHKVESQKWFKEHKRSLEVNVSAANRFISNAIPELTAEQRSALKKARNPGKRVKESQHTEAPSKSPTDDAADFLDSMQVPEQPQRQATVVDALPDAQPVIRWSAQHPVPLPA